MRKIFTIFRYWLYTCQDLNDHLHNKDSYFPASYVWCITHDIQRSNEHLLVMIWVRLGNNKGVIHHCFMICSEWWLKDKKNELLISGNDHLFFFFLFFLSSKVMKISFITWDDYKENCSKNSRITRTETSYWSQTTIENKGDKHLVNR